MRKTSKLFRGFLAVAAMAAFAGMSLPADVQGQAVGAISGTVTGEDGLPVPGVGVTVSGAALAGESRTELTSSGGVYNVTGLPAGTYTLRFVYPGFEPARRDGVEVAAGDRTVVDVQMLSSRTATLQDLTVVVTGTNFAAPPINLPYSVDVSSRAELEEQGSPQAIDFFRKLGANQGSLGETNGYYNGTGSLVPETAASVNLRGLGASRTLVLLNGERQVYVPARLVGGRFVDINTFPSVAIDRIEVLKEGASAIYGSDAVAGVTNFVTRGDFEGFEISGAHEYFSGAGDSNVGAIWGMKLGERTNIVVSGEWAARQELQTAERPGILRAYPGAGGGGWSFYGNPGSFLIPDLAGNETPEQFRNKMVDAQFGTNPRAFVDPACVDFGGEDAGVACRFRYQHWDALIDKQTHLRSFAELNSELGSGTNLHVEALFALADEPEWRVTPSFPPVSAYDNLQMVSPQHPGRRAFCATSAASAGFPSTDSCLENDWFFSGRLVGNSGPGRSLPRRSNTFRVAASLDRSFESLGPGGSNLNVAASYSRAAGNVNQPAEYVYRRFLSYRGFGGPDCGVGVVVDPASPSGMSLGPTGGAVAGQGSCMYYNPFSNAHQRSQQPGAKFVTMDNPGYSASLANSPELLAWINEVVDLDNTAALFVAEATFSGNVVEDAIGYALGYQFRYLDVSATPNGPGNLSLNPCPVPGDRTCLEQAGQFNFTVGYFPYADNQQVHRLYGEVPITVGDWLSLQLAANYEFHKSASSFDPKLAGRVTLTESPSHQLSLRGSVQTTFRVPSVDDVNADNNAAIGYVAEADLYKAIDSHGNPDLKPERALTGNAGVVFFHFPSRLEVTFDFWTYDFDNVISVIPHTSITRLYNEGGASRAAVQDFIKCPDGWGTGTCTAAAIERVRADLVNWPGMQTSGFDISVSSRRPMGSLELITGLNATYTAKYNIDALTVNDVVMQPATKGVARLNRYNPIAWPLPQLKMTATLGFSTGRYTAVGNYHYISAYKDLDSSDPDLVDISPFGTLDLTLMGKITDKMTAFVTTFNLFGTRAPLVNQELSYDPFTHDPKGRRIKGGLTWAIK